MFSGDNDILVIQIELAVMVIFVFFLLLFTFRHYKNVNYHHTINHEKMVSINEKMNNIGNIQSRIDGYITGMATKSAAPTPHTPNTPPS